MAGVEVLPQTNFRERGNKLCIDHVNDELLFVCKDCNETLVCSTCISTTHSGHKVVALRLIVQEKFNRLQDLKASIQDSRIPQMLKKVETEETKSKEAKQEIRDLKKNAIDHGNYLKELIEMSTVKTVSELDDIEYKISREFEQFKHNSEVYIHRLQELMKESQQATQSDNNILILDIEKYSTTIEEPKFEFRAPKMKFMKGSEVESHMKAAFGTFQIEELEKSSRHQSTKSFSSNTLNRKLMKSQVISTLPDLEFQPRSIVRTSKGDVWMCEYNATPNLHTLDVNNYVKTMELDVNIRDISIHPSTDQLYCLSDGNFFHDNTVRTVNIHNRKTTKLFSIKVAQLCMAVTHSGHILIGSCNKPLVTLYTDTGTVVQTIQTINDIGHISVSRTSGYVAFSCCDSFYWLSSGVMVMDRELHHLYTCQPSGAEFNALDADFDNEGHLLIASYSNNRTVYIADSTTGSILKNIPVDRGYPYCLMTQSDGTVLIGTSDGVLYKMKYLE